MSISKTDKQRSMSNWIKKWQLGIYIIVIIILSILPLILKNPYYLHIFILTFIYIVVTVSLRTVVISGQYPLAHGAFMGIGAYTSAVVAKLLGISVWLTIPLGGVVAMLIGALIAFPFSRLRTFYYAMVSLFFCIGITEVIIMMSKWTQGSGGLVGIPYLLPTNSKIPYYYMFFGFMVVCLVALWRFENSRIGLNLKAIAQSYLVASSVGIDESRYRVFVLMVGCFFAGIAGAGYAHYNGILSPTSFDLTANLWLFVYALVGGIASFNGPIIGTALLVLLPNLLNSLKAFIPFVSAAILIVVFYAMPDGLVSLPRIIISRIKNRKTEDLVTGE